MSAFVGAVSGFILGLLVGQFVRFRRVDRKGHTVLKPELDTRPFRSRILNLALVVMFAISTGTLVWFTYSQRECNTEFKRVLTERAAITLDDSQIRKQNDKAVSDLVSGFLTLPSGSERPEQARELLMSYQQIVADNDQRQAANERERSANPYPNPRC